MVLVLSSPVAESWASQIATIELYQSAQVVESRSASERRKVSSNALQNVLVKASGRQDIVAQFPALRSEIGRAASLVQSFSYARVPLDWDENEQSAIIDRLAERENIDRAALNSKHLLTLTFDEGKVRTMLKRVGAPLWQAQRPVVLFEFYERDADSDRIAIEASPTNAGQNDLVDSAMADGVNADRKAAIKNWLVRRAAERGLEINTRFIPVDAQCLPTDGDCGPVFHSKSALNESQRPFSAQAVIDSDTQLTMTPEAKNYYWVVQGRLDTAGYGDDIPDYRQFFNWKLIEQQQSNLTVVEQSAVVNQDQHQDTNLTASLTRLVNRIADRLASRYAVGSMNGVGEVNQYAADFTISAIQTADDYLELQKLIASTGALEGARLISVQADELRYRLPLGTNIDTIKSLLMLSGRLGVKQEQPLSFRWVHNSENRQAGSN